MKILITLPNLNTQGGVSGFYAAVLPRLQKSKKFRIKLIEIGRKHDSNHRLHILSDQVSFFKQILRYRFDLIHVNPSLNLKSFLRDGLFVWLAKIHRIPVLVYFRGWDVFFEKHVEHQWRHYFNITYRKADGFCVLAKEFKEKLLEWGVDVPIYVGSGVVDSDLLDGFSIDHKIIKIQSEGLIRILFMARLEEEKGIFETIEAVGCLRDRGYAVQLTVAGDGSAREKVIDYIGNNFRHPDIVKLIGFVRRDEKKEVFRLNHLYCLPTNYGEGMPNSLLEAMAFGMPVVTRPVGGIKDFFVDGKMGFVTQSKNPIKFAELLSHLISNREEMAEIAAYNHYYATENFLSPKVANDLCFIYRKMVRR